MSSWYAHYRTEKKYRCHDTIKTRYMMNTLELCLENSDCKPCRRKRINFFRSMASPPRNTISAGKCKSMLCTQTKLKNLPKGKNASSMKQIYSYYNAPKTKGEINTAPSRTIPDQSMTVREIINRSNKGLPITGVKVPMYNETDENRIFTRAI